MFHALRFSLIVAIAAIALGATARADESSTDIKASPYTSAAGINFAQELGVDFPSAAQLGARIEAARTAPDPVGLASAARELEVLEHVSGKTASISSSQLEKEAIELAKRRMRPAELKAVGHIFHDEELEKLVEKAEHMEHAAKEARERGEKSRGIQGSLYIYNHTPWFVNVYVNGGAVGTAAPWTWISVPVLNGPFDNTLIYANNGIGQFWNTAVPNPTGDYHFHLYP